MSTNLLSTAAFILLTLFCCSSSALSDEPLNVLEYEAEQLGNIDINDARSQQRYLGFLYLRCAAFYKAVSAAASPERPALSKLYDEKLNWYSIVGAGFIAGQQDVELGKVESLVEAYIESYTLDRVYKYTKSDMELRFELCEKDSFVKGGQEMFDDLESQLDTPEQ